MGVRIRPDETGKSEVCYGFDTNYFEPAFIHHRRSATRHQIASTSPNGQAP